MPPLETARLLLEQWDERHREPWRLICSDPDVMRFIGAGEPWTTSEADEVFDRMLAHWSARGFGWRSVIERATGRWLGFVGLNALERPVASVAVGEVELGWWIVRSAWRHGYASEGAASARDEGFGPIALHRMIARLQPANRASARVAEKLGMQLEHEGAGRYGERLLVYALDRATWMRQVRGERGARAGSA